MQVTVQEVPACGTQNSYKSTSLLSFHVGTGMAGAGLLTTLGSHKHSREESAIHVAEHFVKFTRGGH